MRRVRTVVTSDSRPALPRHVRLHHDRVRGRMALLSPEKILWPDETSLDILTRCDGTRSVGRIAEELGAEYDARPEDIEADVIDFVQEWSDRLLLHDAASERAP